MHWIHGGAFCILLLTGLVSYISPAAPLTQATWLHVVHQVTAVIFILVPLIYLTAAWKGALAGIEEAFIWGADDMEWLMALPRYYYLPEEGMLPLQENLNAFQKLWWSVVIVFGTVLIISGAIMYALQRAVISALFKWAIAFHDIAFIVAGNMFLLHLCVSLIYPLPGARRNKSWRAMTRGKISIEYAITGNVEA